MVVSRELIRESGRPPGWVCHEKTPRQDMGVGFAVWIGHVHSMSKVMLAVTRMVIVPPEMGTVSAWGASMAISA